MFIVVLGKSSFILMFTEMIQTSEYKKFRTKTPKQTKQQQQNKTSVTE